jgi:hypothetical protein
MHGPQDSGAVLHRDYALLAGAVRTAIHYIVSLYAMAKDSAPTMVKGGRQRLDGALKAIEGMRRVRHDDRKGFVVLISTGFTLRHSDDSFSHTPEAERTPDALSISPKVRTIWSSPG